MPSQRAHTAGHAAGATAPAGVVHGLLADAVRRPAGGDGLRASGPPERVQGVLYRTGDRASRRGRTGHAWRTGRGNHIGTDR